MVDDGLTRLLHVDYEKLPQMINYYFKEYSTQRIFRIEETEIEDAYPEDSDEEGNVIVSSRVQDADFEVSLQEKQAIFEKVHNSVIGHLEVDRSQAPRPQLEGYERRFKDVYIRVYHLSKDQVEKTCGLGRLS